MKTMFGITELTENHANRVAGFIVRLGWCAGRPSIHQEFSTEDFGGREHALQAAKTFRDEQLEKLKQEGKWPVERILTKPQCNNSSGVLGVSRSRQWSQGKPSNDIFCWQATWRCKVKKKAVTVKFSERKWGADTAFAMACACREAKRQIY